MPAMTGDTFRSDMLAGLVSGVLLAVDGGYVIA
jgi:hypothetical protein